MKIAETPIPFVKMNGAGNDFIIIDHRIPLIANPALPEFVRQVCRRKYSVGADGVFFIENSDIADFKWQFFNADGSVAEMCGNGARCVARYAYMHGIAPAKMRFETLAGIIEAGVADTDVSVRMTPPHSFDYSGRLEVGGQELEVHFMDTGVPHVVIFVDDVEGADVVGIGREVRNHPRYQPAGTNVNFVGQVDGIYKVRTYERGVEDETRACGTGAVAGALAASYLKQASSPVEILTSGNSRLFVSFDIQPENRVENVLLKGPAHVIYKGELTAEALW